MLAGDDQRDRSSASFDDEGSIHRNRDLTNGRPELRFCHLTRRWIQDGDFLQDLTEHV
jgi:hypothetical protein